MLELVLQSQLIKQKDFGPYAEKDGNLYVGFISNNDITGGNSGSPVINGKGELIGCAFLIELSDLNGAELFFPIVHFSIIKI